MGEKPDVGVVCAGAARALKSVEYWAWKVDGGVVDSEREEADAGTVEVEFETW